VSEKETRNLAQEIRSIIFTTAIATTLFVPAAVFAQDAVEQDQGDG